MKIQFYLEIIQMFMWHPVAQFQESGKLFSQIRQIRHGILENPNCLLHSSSFSIQFSCTVMKLLANIDISIY